MLDLLHHLLYHEEDGSVVRILKFSLEGGSCEKEILSSLKIYKVIFSRYGESKFSPLVKVAYSLHAGILAAHQKMNSHYERK